MKKLALTGLGLSSIALALSLRAGTLPQPVTEVDEVHEHIMKSARHMACASHKAGNPSWKVRAIIADQEEFCSPSDFLSHAKQPDNLIKPSENQKRMAAAVVTLLPEEEEWDDPYKYQYASLMAVVFLSGPYSTLKVIVEEDGKEVERVLKK